MSCFHQTTAMLKLDVSAVLEKDLKYFGKNVAAALKELVNKRKDKEKIFLAMDVDSENSKPMNLNELCTLAPY